VGRERCDNCGREGPAKRFTIGVGARSRAVRLCVDCGGPITELWSSTTPAQVRRREALERRMAVVDPDGRVRPVKGRKNGG